MPRSFLAIPLPPSVRTACAQAAERIRTRVAMRANWVPPERMHLTIHFLGEISEKEQQRIHEHCQELLLGKPELRLDGLGLFGTRVLWAGIAGEGLAELHETLAGALELEEERAYHPHITLARITHVARKEHLANALREESLPRLRWEPDSCILMESDLTRDGPIYTERARYALQ